MSVRRPRAALVAVLAGLVCAVSAACSTLPDSGDVHTRPAGTRETANQAPYDFAPPGPTQDASPSDIVNGFLLAMQANPPSTAVARSFLSSRAKATWTPNQGTIVYDAPSLDAVGNRVTATLRGAHRLSPQGSWLDGTTASTVEIPLSLVQEDGQWRIDNPPNALAVPSSYFSSLFAPFTLYFFDHTGTVLVPTTVYVPRGEDTATNLVRGLLGGPPPWQRDVAVSAFPTDMSLDLGVVVSDSGIAEVPLGPALLQLAPTELHRVVAQLAWTLRQVPGINRLQITVDGAPVPLTAGRTDVSVSEGAAYDPLIASQRDLLAIAGGRIVRDDATNSAVSGPLGQTGFALRSLAWSARDHLLAAVSADGRRVYQAPDRGDRSAARVQTVYSGGSNVLRPSYDRFGGLWLVDDTKTGAVVHLVRRGLDRTLRIRGITGRPVSAFTITRDGTALVAVLSTGTNPTIEVSSLVRKSGGRLLEAQPARTLQVGGADLGPARDVGQNGATSVALLTDPPTGPDQIVFVELDGSPGVQQPAGSDAPQTVPGDLLSLVSSSDPVLSLRAVGADRRLYTYTEVGRWVRSSLGAVAGAAYAQ